MTAPFLTVPWGAFPRSPYSRWCDLVGHIPNQATRQWWGFAHGIGTILTATCTVCGAALICCNRTMDWVPRFDIPEVPF